ncbi:hypothetical protein M8J77_020693 [Diaphorina citri]|nr:hypothetical protein M8J77_020693 [Diaphorina citri]
MVHPFEYGSKESSTQNERTNQNARIPCIVAIKKTQWIGINQIIEDLAFEASVAMFIGLIEDLQVQGQQGQHLTFHI